MTFGVAVRATDGIVALADTRVVRGEQHSTKAKLSMIEHGGGSAFVMTSGLRSVRDKTIMHLTDELASLPEPCGRMHQLATRYGAQLRQVRADDGPALEGAGLSFNVHTILGGQMADDTEPELFYVYPEGNWITATADVPYFIVGRTPYGQPILDRLARCDMPLQSVIGLAYLAFDATRASVVDVDFPIDIVTFAGSVCRQRRFDAAELDETHRFWQDRLSQALTDLPTDWTHPLIPPDPGAERP
jgi:putative proteasome-type protease